MAKKKSAVAKHDHEEDPSAAKAAESASTTPIATDLTPSTAPPLANGAVVAVIAKDPTPAEEGTAHKSVDEAAAKKAADEAAAKKAADEAAAKKAADEAAAKKAADEAAAKKAADEAAAQKAVDEAAAKKAADEAAAKKAADEAVDEAAAKKAADEAAAQKAVDEAAAKKAADEAAAKKAPDEAAAQKAADEAAVVAEQKAPQGGGPGGPGGPRRHAPTVRPAASAVSGLERVAAIPKLQGSSDRLRERVGTCVHNLMAARCPERLGQYPAVMALYDGREEVLLDALQAVFGAPDTTTSSPARSDQRGQSEVRSTTTPNSTPFVASPVSRRRCASPHAAQDHLANVPLGSATRIAGPQQGSSPSVADYNGLADYVDSFVSPLRYH